MSWAFYRLIRPGRCCSLFSRAPVGPFSVSSPYIAAVGRRILFGLVGCFAHRPGTARVLLLSLVPVVWTLWGRQSRNSSKRTQVFLFYGRWARSNPGAAVALGHGDLWVWLVRWPIR